MASDVIYINGKFAAQNLSGVQRFAAETAVALREVLGDRVQLLMPPDARLDFDGGRMVGNRVGRAWEQFDLPKFAKDGILINFGNTGPILARRQIVVVHDAGVFSTPEAYSWKFRVWYKALQYLLIKFGAQIVTVSTFSRREIARHLPVLAADISVIPEGADHMSNLATDCDVLQMHGLEPQKFVFAVGTLAAHKNLSALNVLAERLVERGLVLVISGAFGAAAFRAGTPNQLPGAARYVGRVSDEALKALYCNATCYVLPSTYEGFGLTAVEAMYCGCPVVAADIPALRETCGDAAVFFDPTAPNEIADTVLELIDAPERLASLSTQAFEHVRTLTWRNAAMALSDVVDARFRAGAAGRVEDVPAAKAGIAHGQGSGEPGFKVSVVVASVNRPEEIGQLLVALKGQTLQPVAIVLSVASVADLPAYVPPGVEVVMGTPGLAAQRNRGMELVLSRSDAVVFFDDDFIPTKNALRGVSEFFTTFPDVAGGTGHVLYDGVNVGGISYESALEIIRKFEAEPGLPLRNDDFLFAYGCNMAFRASAIGELRFDENLPLYGWQEDMDFAGQISVRGKVIRTSSFAGVHRGVNKGRSPGVMLGFSQIINPAYLVRKGTMRPKKAVTLMVKNLLANHLKVFRPEPYVDRAGRIRGNWRGLANLLRGNFDPKAVLSLKR